MKKILTNASIVLAIFAFTSLNVSAQSDAKKNNVNVQPVKVKTNAKSLKKVSKLAPADKKVTKSNTNKSNVKVEKVKNEKLQLPEEKKKPLKASEVTKEKIEK